MVIAGRQNQIECPVASIPWSAQPTEDVGHVQFAEIICVHVGSRPAFTSMYNRFGGVPRKQGRVDRGAPWNRETINTLFDLASQSILEEVSG